MLPILRNDSMLSPMTSGPSNRLDSFFDRVFGEDRLFGQTWGGGPMEMWEDDDHIYVEVDLPGMTDQDVDITIHNGMLFVRGERKPEEGRSYVYNDRSYGRFERVITLPEAVEADGVEAKLTNGVLAVSLPKSPDAKPKRIALKTS